MRSALVFRSRNLFFLMTLLCHSGRHGGDVGLFHAGIRAILANNWHRTEISILRIVENAVDVDCNWLYGNSVIYELLCIIWIMRRSGRVK